MPIEFTEGEGEMLDEEIQNLKGHLKDLPDSGLTQNPQAPSFYSDILSKNLSQLVCILPTLPTFQT